MADKYEYSQKHKTPIFRGAFVYLFDKPQEDAQTGRKTWSVTGILEKPEDAAIFKTAMQEAAKKMWGDKAATMVRNPKFRNPIKDGDTFRTREGELYAGFEPGQVVVKLTTASQAPGVVDKMARTIRSADGITLVDKAAGVWEEIEGNQIFSGVYFRATFTAQAYDRSDGFGVSFKLENLQLVRPGEKLGGGGRAKAEEDFEAIDNAGDDDFFN